MISFKLKKTYSGYKLLAPGSESFMPRQIVFGSRTVDPRPQFRIPNSEFRIKKGRLPALFGYAMVSMYLRMFDTLVIFSMLPSFATISVGAIFTPCSLANASLSSA